ncbi:MAG: class I adenylate-forming enzyme family protein [Xanthobacteraceae bacterium]
MNIVEPILFHAKNRPEAPALCTPGDDVITYARLAARMNNVARRAIAAGLKRGNVVALSIPDQLTHSVVILGLTQMGIIPISVGMRRPPAGLRIDAVLGTTHYPFAPQALHLPLDFSWIMGDGRPVEASSDSASEDDEICRIMLTTGTTGEPKAVALTHKLGLARNARFQFLQGSHLPTCSRIFMNVGVATAVGYYFLTYMLARGGTLFFRGDHIENTLRSIGTLRVQGMITWTGNLPHLLEICDRDPSCAFHLDAIFCGGSVLSQAMYDRVRPRLCSHLLCRYGATETGTTAAAPAQRIAHIPGAVGYVVAGATVEIVDELDRCLPIGSEGIVRIANEVAVDCYLDDAAASAQYFRNGWFYPGDLGSLTKDNLLIISGRVNSVLNLGGAKMEAEKLEAVLTSFRGLTQAAIVLVKTESGADEIWAAVVRSETLDAESLLAHCRQRMPPAFVPKRVVALGELPLNATGKLDRARLAQILGAGRT